MPSYDFLLLRLMLRTVVALPNIRVPGWNFHSKLFLLDNALLANDRLLLGQDNHSANKLMVFPLAWIARSCVLYSNSTARWPHPTADEKVPANDYPMIPHYAIKVNAGCATFPSLCIQLAPISLVVGNGIQL